MQKLKLPKDIIEENILNHYRENYDPQKNELEYVVSFDYKTGDFTFKIEIVYSTSIFQTYIDEEISCKCIFEIAFELIDSTHEIPLYQRLNSIQDIIDNDFENKKNEPDDRLNICEHYKDFM